MADQLTDCTGACGRDEASRCDGATADRSSPDSQGGCSFCLLECSSVHPIGRVLDAKENGHGTDPQQDESRPCRERPHQSEHDTHSSSAVIGSLVRPGQSNRNIATQLFISRARWSTTCTRCSGNSASLADPCSPTGRSTRLARLRWSPWRRPPLGGEHAMSTRPP
jgi:hypothetical protein